MVCVVAKLYEPNQRHSDVVTITDVTLNVTDMPKLTGTPKQVEWAERIRTDAIQDIADELFRVFAKNRPSLMIKVDEAEKLNAMLNKNCQTLATKLDKLTSSVWWIENMAKLNHGRAKGTISMVLNVEEPSG